MNPESLSIKLLDISDIPAVLNYWMNASSEYLESMGADIEKMPSEQDFKKMLLKQLDTPLEQKSGLATIWMIDGKRVGHCNVNQLEFGKELRWHQGIHSFVLLLQKNQHRYGPFY